MAERRTQEGIEMERRKARLFSEDDPIFSDTNARLLPKSVREYMEAQRAERDGPAVVKHKGPQKGRKSH